MTALAIAFGVAGLTWGFIADRIAARWPAHEDGVVDRPIDWRTPVVAVFGALALAGVATRYPDGIALLLFAATAAALTLLLATDLDQKLLPDVLTLPLIPIAGLAGMTGANPLVTEGMLWPLAAAIGIPLALYLLSIPFGDGAIGIGDLKLLVGVGLLVGPYRAVVGLIVGALASAALIVLLMAARRITLKTYIPFGPFLIGGAIWAILAQT